MEHVCSPCLVCLKNYSGYIFQPVFKYYFTIDFLKIKGSPSLFSSKEKEIFLRERIKIYCQQYSENKIYYELLLIHEKSKNLKKLCQIYYS